MLEQEYDSLKILRCFNDVFSDEMNYSVVLSRRLMKTENKLLASNHMLYRPVKLFHVTGSFM